MVRTIGWSGILLGWLICTVAVARAEFTPGVQNAIVAALNRNHVLSKAQAKCVTYVPEKENADFIEVEVREVHGHGCPGDPQTAPRLFNVRYEKRTHAVLKENDAMNGYDRLR